MKTCSKCGLSKHKTEFHRDAQKKDGLRSECKACYRNKPKCSVEGCQSRSASAGMCSAHYQRNLRNGTTEKLDRHIRHISDRFNEKYTIDETSKCWNWLGTKNTNGYGLIYDHEKKRSVLAHRVSYELFVGQIQEIDGYHGACVCHRCDNPSCVNPNHLFLGTHQDNMIDMYSKERHRILNGETHPLAKITEQQASKIKELLSSGVAGKRIAADFGISPSIVSRIKTRKNWKNVEAAK